MTEFRYVTFDCYGTLIDWKSGIEVALGEARGKAAAWRRDVMGAYLAAEKVEEGKYKTYREVLRDSALRVAEGYGANMAIEKAEGFAASVPNWPAFPDSSEGLKSLGRMGLKRFILSNVDTDLLQGTIRNSGFEVDGYVTAEQIHSYKPATGHWTAFMERTGANKEEVLHVAQSLYHDIIPTQGLGIASAWVNRYREPLPPEARPAYIADSLASLVGLLQ